MTDRLILAGEAQHPRPIFAVGPQDWRGAIAGLPGIAASFAETSGFRGERGAVLVLPDDQGGIAGVLFGQAKDNGEKADDPLAFGKLAGALPEGDYTIAQAPADVRLAVLGFALGCVPLRALPHAQRREAAPRGAGWRRHRRRSAAPSRR